MKVSVRGNDYENGRRVHVDQAKNKSGEGERGTSRRYDSIGVTLKIVRSGKYCPKSLVGSKQEGFNVNRRDRT